MTEQNHKRTNSLQPRLVAEELDVAGKALSEALRISFIILKIIMIVLIVVFIASGFRTIGSDEQALVLWFGEISGIGESRILKPGLKWVFPYPINELIKIPVEKKLSLPVNSFWYYQKGSDMLPEELKERSQIAETLDPMSDGYCITRSEKQNKGIVGSTDSDYNIVHCKWQLIYKIDDPERFFRNVYVEDIKPGEIYSEVMTRNVKPLLENMADDAIVATMVNYTIDDVLTSSSEIPGHVRKLLQKKLDEIESGITIESVQFTEKTWPRQVDYAFSYAIKASQASQQAVSEAKGYAENTLNEAAGPVAGELLAALENKNLGEQEKELLWAQLAGQSQEKIAQAKAYRTKVVESARATADYLQQLLPEYRKRPKLVVQKIYQDAIEEILNNVDEKMIIQPTEGTKGSEIRVLVNRDPTIKPKKSEKQQ